MNTIIMKCIFYFTILLFSQEVSGWQMVSFDTDAELSLNDLAIRLGYDGVKSFMITTEDGYNVLVYRIIREGADKMRPILFLHGLTACADSFFARKNTSPAIFFANNGYDIWLLNNRGAKNSLGHTKWNHSTDKEYWNFSFDEIGTKDAAASVDLVLKNNAHDKVTLIGHSQGSTDILAFLSEKHEYNEKIAVSFHWGVGYALKQCMDVALMKFLCRNFSPIFLDVSEKLGLFGLYTKIFLDMRSFLKSLCRLDTFRQTCKEGAKFLTQSDEQVDDVEDWSFMLTKCLCSGSLKELSHHMQLSYNHRFAKYDYGPQKNLEVYGSTKPPLFNLSRLTSPTVLWCGNNDIFCHVDDVDELKRKLPNVISDTFKGKPFWTHIDFVLAKDAIEYVFIEMLTIIEKYTT